MSCKNNATNCAKDLLTVTGVIYLQASPGTSGVMVESSLMQIVADPRFEIIVNTKIPGGLLAQAVQEINEELAAPDPDKLHFVEGLSTQINEIMRLHNEGKTPTYLTLVSMAKSLQEKRLGLQENTVENKKMQGQLFLIETLMAEIEDSFSIAPQWSQGKNGATVQKIMDIPLGGVYLDVARSNRDEVASRISSEAPNSPGITNPAYYLGRLTQILEFNDNTTYADVLAEWESLGEQLSHSKDDDESETLLGRIYVCERLMRTQKSRFN